MTTESAADPGTPQPGLPAAGPAPATGDLVIDAALTDVAQSADLDALLHAGTSIDEVLRGRLRDLSS